MGKRFLRQEYLDTLRETPHTQDRVQAAFQKIQPIEDRMGVILEEMTEEQTHECLRNWKSSYGSRYITLKNCLRNYLDWVNVRLGNADAPNYVASFQVPAEALLPTFFDTHCTFEDVYREVATIYPTTEGFLIYPLLCLLWLGLPSNAALHVRNEDVDIQRARIYFRELDLWRPIKDKRVLELLSIYKNTVRGLRTQNRTFWVDLIDIGLFLKQTRSKNSHKAPELTNAHLDRALGKFNIDYEKRFGVMPQINCNTILMLGIMNRIYQAEEVDGENIDAISLSRLREINPYMPVRWTGAYTKMVYDEYKRRYQARRERGE